MGWGLERRRQLGARRRQLGTRDETRCSTRGGGGWSRGALRVQGYGGLGKSFFVWRRPAGGSRTTGGVHSSSSSTLAACSSSAKSSPAAANTPMLCLPPVGGKEREGVNYTVNHKPYRSDGKKTMRSASAKRRGDHETRETGRLSDGTVSRQHVGCIPIRSGVEMRSGDAPARRIWTLLEFS